uniref:Immunoglobulin V-set domain-containing protein n=1 Tax=Poecilia latipinna TaxID=48699 RepID=A0A3B3VZE0_9TELE
TNLLGPAVFLWSESDASSWTSTSPASVKGLLGSCVVIPCSFNYPDKGSKYEFTGIWNNPNGVIFHSGSGQTVQAYRNRVELVGELEGKNCSLKIDPLQKSDVGPLDFRIEIKSYDSFSYKNNIAISVIRGTKCVCILLRVSLLPLLSSPFQVESPWRGDSSVPTAWQCRVEHNVYSELSANSY